jgi:hypothetical protein
MQPQPLGPGQTHQQVDVDALRELREQHLAYLEQWRTELSPILENKRESHKGSIALGEAVLKSCFLLNGGALIAIPVFAGLVDVHGSAATGRLLSPVCWFITGLVACCLAGIVGHLALRRDVKGYFHDFERLAIGVKLAHGKEPNPAAAAQRQTAEQELAKETFKSAERLAITAACLAGFSLLAFVVGAVSGGTGLMG